MIILLGMPRSGTTWVAKAIDSNPTVHYLHEPDSAQRIDVPNIVLADEVATYQPVVDAYLERVHTVRDPKVVGRLPFFEKAHHSGAALAFNRASVFAHKAASRAFKPARKWAPVLLPPRAEHELFFKSIESMGRATLLAQSPQQPKVVLLVRHPCAVINSELRGEAQKRFASGTPIYENWGLFANLLRAPIARAHDLTIERLQALTAPERLAWKWRIYHHALLDSAAHPNCQLVHYEDLCRDPHAGFAEVFDFLGLNFTGATRAYLDESTTSHSDSYYAISKDPEVAMHSWKSQLGSASIDAILAIAGDALSAAAKHRAA